MSKGCVYNPVQKDDLKLIDTCIFCKVLIVDKCPEEWVGGNGYFTAGAHRTVHGGLHDLLPVISGALPPEVVELIDMVPYTKEEFVSDIMRLGGGQSDDELVTALVENSRETVGWLADRVGVPFKFSFNRQAYEIEGRQKFWGGMVLSVEDGGKGLIAAYQVALKKAKVDVWFDTPALSLVTKDGGISGIVVRRDGQELELQSRAVILAAGGFEASAALRSKHIGADWKQAKVSHEHRSPFHSLD